MPGHRELPDRLLDGLDTDRTVAIDRLFRVVRGGTVSPEELSLAEALLLTVLVAGTDDDGIGRPLRPRDGPAARFPLSTVMARAWQSLLDRDIVAVHRSTPSAAFTSDPAGNPVPVPGQIVWFVARGRAGDSAADTRVATWTVVHDALRASTWPSRWVLETQEVAADLIVAEGLSYFLHLLHHRGSVELPTPAGHRALRLAMEDAATDHSIGQLYYLAYKPIAHALDPYRAAGTKPSSETIDDIVTEFTRRAPRHRANGWQAEIYDQRPAGPLSGVCAALFTVLGLDPHADPLDCLVDAAYRKVDQPGSDELEEEVVKNELLKASPLPPGAWAAVLQTLKVAQAPVAFEDSGWEIPQSRDYYEATERRCIALAASVHDYLVEIDAAEPGERPRHLADAYRGAALAAYALLRQESDSIDIGEVQVLATALQHHLVTAYSSTSRNSAGTT